MPLWRTILFNTFSILPGLKFQFTSIKAAVRSLYRWEQVEILGSIRECYHSYVIIPDAKSIALNSSYLEHLKFRFWTKPIDDMLPIVLADQCLLHCLLCRLYSVEWIMNSSVFLYPSFSKLRLSFLSFQGLMIAQDKLSRIMLDQKRFSCMRLVERRYDDEMRLSDD